MARPAPEREEAVIQYMEAVSCSTVDEFLLAHPRYYINSWAPVFTALLQRGVLRRTGDKRMTRHGGQAHVLELTGTA